MRALITMRAVAAITGIHRPPARPPAAIKMSRSSSYVHQTVSMLLATPANPETDPGNDLIHFEQYAVRGA